AEDYREVFAKIISLETQEKMERPIASLAFTGSIGEAIVEAKRLKKLFVVYISVIPPRVSTGRNGLEHAFVELLHLGTNPAFGAIATSYLAVRPSIAKIASGDLPRSFLHVKTWFHFVLARKLNTLDLKERNCEDYGNLDCCLWTKEGFVTAEILASSLEKAWLSLHIQETTATFLTAALASKNSEQHASQTANAAILEQGSSSSSGVPSTSTDKHINYSEATTLENPDVVKENKHCEHAVEEIRSKFCDEISPAAISSSELESGDIEQVLQATSLPDMANESLNHVKIAFDSTEVEDKCTVRENTLDVVGQHSGGNLEFQVIPTEASETANDEKTEVSEIEKADVIHLNLRLPEGASLQEKFSIMSTLRMVKDYVDENQESDVGSYDIAIPYPRKVFHDEGPNPALQHHLRSSARNPVFSSNQSDTPATNQSDTPATGGNNSKSRKQTSPGFGSNIHTLKHDEEDSRFNDRNAFWNGNSTQYGGDTDGK
ncbi:hypothetical protein RJ640_009552, partial [Escallonia rubra]